MKHRAHKSFDIFHSFEYYIPGWKGMFMIILMLLCGIILGYAVTFLLGLFIPAAALAQYSILITYPLQFIPAMLYASAQSHIQEGFDNKGVCLDRNNFGESGWPLFALVAALGTLCAAVVSEPLIAVLPKMPEWIKAMLDMLVGGPLWISLLATAVMAPFFEEWLCRGIILRGMLQHSKPQTAILVSAAFFAVIHLNPWQAIPAFLLGCLFGLVYYKTGSLKLTMLMHCVNNSFSVLMSRCDAFKNSDYLWDAVGSKTTYGVIFVICAFALVLIVRWLSGLNSSFQRDAQTRSRD